MKKQTVTTAAGVAVFAVMVGAGMVWLTGVTGGIQAAGPSPTPTQSVVMLGQFDLNGFAEGPTKAPAPIEVKAPAATVDAPASEPAPAPEPVFVPTRCPAGTVANAVDAQGNESNCAAPCSQVIVNEDGSETCVPFSGAPSRWGDSGQA